MFRISTCFPEGIKDREHASLILTLKQVAFFRDNMYQLQRPIWEDVKEDWPFYTEQERAMLKRRKPQNLTPPGSSDTSIGKCLSKYTQSRYLLLSR